MKRIWNPIYKRFECKKCLEEWPIDKAYIHKCQSQGLSIVEIYWTSLTNETKAQHRKIFNNISEEDYKKYDDVADYAFYNRI